jgi:hypothetical protein
MIRSGSLVSIALSPSIRYPKPTSPGTRALPLFIAVT